MYTVKQDDNKQATKQPAAFYILVSYVNMRLVIKLMVSGCVNNLFKSNIFRLWYL